MASTITALTGGGGVAVAGDTSGVLELKTNNGTTAMTIDTSQNVLIGTTSAGRKLTVAGAALDNVPVRIIGGTGTTDCYIDFKDSNTTADYKVRVGSTGDNLALYAGGSERMRIAADGTITASNGNVLLVSGTAVSATGTSIDFTGIPSWVKRITVMFNGVSLNGTANQLIQIGSGSISSSGYISYGNFAGGSNAAGNASSTAGFVIVGANAAAIIYGTLTITNITGNTWVCSYSFGGTTGTVYGYSGGGVSPSLSGSLDRVRITSANGTDTFDAGTINILYE